MAFTDDLQALMGAKGVSRRKSAKECGISPGAVSPWFSRSAENISLQTLKKLSDYFGASIEELVHGKQRRREIAFPSNTCTDDELNQIAQFAQLSIGQRGKGQLMDGIRNVPAQVTRRRGTRVRERS